jgi:hypothetical protein
MEFCSVLQNYSSVMLNKQGIHFNRGIMPGGVSIIKISG